MNEYYIDEFEVLETYETTQALSDQEIIELMRLQILNDVEIHRVNILMFGALLSLIVVISFFRGVFNNA